MRITLGTALLKSGARMVLRTGNCLVGSIRKLPFLNDLIVFAQASVLEYTKLPSIQLVTLFICNLT